MSEFHWPEWEELQEVADRIVTRTRDGLPPEVRAAAVALPVSCLPVPDEALVEDGVAEDLLGLFVGNDLAAGSEGAAPLPAQIFLFLDNIWDYADGDWRAYRSEVKTTYLHELGHYLGWDEDEVERRGLG